MGECLITRRGGEVKKLPILHSSYPEDVTVSVVDSSAKTVYFAVEISEPGNPHIYTYQWYVAGLAVEGATESTFVLDVSDSKGQYSVWCDVTNKAGTVRTRVATLTVNKLPVLNASYPADATVTIGKSGTFQVSIAEQGYPANYTYQWYVNGNAVSGATKSSYTRTRAIEATDKIYCVVTNDAGSTQSRTATLRTDVEYLFKDCALTGGGDWGAYAEDSDSMVDFQSNALRVMGDGEGATIAYTTIPYDFTGKDRLAFHVQFFESSGGSGTIYFGASDTQGDTDFVASTATLGVHGVADQTFAVDVSHLSGLHYIKIAIIRTGYDQDTVYVDSIYFG